MGIQKKWKQLVKTALPETLGDKILISMDFCQMFFFLDGFMKGQKPSKF